MDILNTQVCEICMIGNEYAKDIAGAKSVGIKTILLTAQEGEYQLADKILHLFMI